MKWIAWFVPLFYLAQKRATCAFDLVKNFLEGSHMNKNSNQCLIFIIQSEMFGAEKKIITNSF